MTKRLTVDEAIKRLENINEDLLNLKTEMENETAFNGSDIEFEGGVLLMLERAESIIDDQIECLAESRTI